MTKRLSSKFIGAKKGAVRVKGIMSDPNKLLEIEWRLIQDTPDKFREYDLARYSTNVKSQYTILD